MRSIAQHLSWRARNTPTPATLLPLSVWMRGGCSQGWFTPVQSNRCCVCRVTCLWVKVIRGEGRIVQMCGFVPLLTIAALFAAASFFLNQCSLGLETFPS